MSRIFCVLGMLFCASFIAAEEYLLSIQDLPKERRRNLNIIEFFDNTSLVLGDENTIQKLSEFRVPSLVLDKNPRQTGEEYFIVTPMAESVRSIREVSTVLAVYEHVVVVKVQRDNLTAFFDKRMEKAKIDFSPYLFDESVPPELDCTLHQKNGTIEDLVKMVSKDSIRSYLKTMQPFNRLAEKSSEACDWLVKKFKELGADSVYTESVSGYGPNVIAIMKGKNNDLKKYCLIGGHFDAVVAGAGADDNGSGTAAAMEALRVLRRVPFENTIRFIGFNAEERGLVGSGVYAKTAKARGDVLVGGCINFDMIGYCKSGAKPTLYLHANSTAGNKEWVASFQTIAKKYVPDLNTSIPTSSGFLSSSDHASFWRNGYIAFLGIEATGFGGLCPNYHKAGDKLDDPGALNDSELVTNCVRAAVANLATLAIPAGTGIVKRNAHKNNAAFTIVKNKGNAVTINFYIADNGVGTTVNVYNMQGRNIAVVTDKIFTPGYHSLLWPAGCSAGGVYLVELVTGGAVQSQKYLVR